MQVKTVKKGNVICNICDDYIPKEKEKYKENLRSLYDTLNSIYLNRDIKNLFYTSEELEFLRKTKEKIFI